MEFPKSFLLMKGEDIAGEGVCFTDGQCIINYNSEVSILSILKDGMDDVERANEKTGFKIVYNVRTCDMCERKNLKIDGNTSSNE